MSYTDRVTQIRELFSSITVDSAGDKKAHENKNIFNTNEKVFENGFNKDPLNKNQQLMKEDWKQKQTNTVVVTDKTHKNFNIDSGSFKSDRSDVSSNTSW